MPPSSPAICLLSGGLDSTTCLAYAKREGYRCYALTFDYGQRHRHELTAAWKVAQAFGVEEHIVFPLPLSRFGGSALTGDMKVPKHRATAQMADEIPVTYVPARNTVFLSVALAYAETVGASDIFAGMNAIDYSGYPDCRPEYLEAFQLMANLATKAGVSGGASLRIHTPLLSLSKAGIVLLADELGVDFSMTFSCYDPDPDGRPCRFCDACLLRQQGFEEAGIEDQARS